MSTAQVDGADAKGNQLTSEEQTDLVFKALASKPRREMLALLATDAGESGRECCSPEGVCACVFVEKLGLGAPTVSHHAKVLIDAGLVTGEKRGSWVYYRLCVETVQRVANDLMALVGCCGGKCS